MKGLAKLSLIVWKVEGYPDAGPVGNSSLVSAGPQGSEGWKLKVWPDTVVEQRSHGSSLINSAVPVGKANVQMKPSASLAVTFRDVGGFGRRLGPQKVWSWKMIVRLFFFSLPFLLTWLADKKKTHRHAYTCLYCYTCEDSHWQCIFLAPFPNPNLNLNLTLTLTLKASLNPQKAWQHEDRPKCPHFPQNDVTPSKQCPLTEIRLIYFQHAFVFFFFLKNATTLTELT